MSQSVSYGNNIILLPQYVKTNVTKGKNGCHNRRDEVRNNLSA